MFEIWTSYTEEVNHGDRKIGGVGFTVPFIPDDDHMFYLHAYGYTNPFVDSWSPVDALYPRPPHVARDAVEPIVRTDQSYGRVVPPMMNSCSGNCGHVVPASEKGTRVYHSDRPASTLTSHMNTLFLICAEDGGGERGVSYLDLESVVSMKSFCEAETSFIRGTPLGRAFRVVANAILCFLLRTVCGLVLQNSDPPPQARKLVSRGVPW